MSRKRNALIEAHQNPTIRSVAIDIDRLLVVDGEVQVEIPFSEITKIVLSNFDQITTDQIWLSVTTEDGSVTEFSEDYVGFGDFCDRVGDFLDVDWEAMNLHRRTAFLDQESVFFVREEK